MRTAGEDHSAPLAVEEVLERNSPKGTSSSRGACPPRARAGAHLLRGVTAYRPGATRLRSSCALRQAGWGGRLLLRTKSWASGTAGWVQARTCSASIGTRFSYWRWGYAKLDILSCLQSRHRPWCRAGSGRSIQGRPGQQLTCLHHLARLPSSVTGLDQACLEHLRGVQVVLSAYHPSSLDSTEALAGNFASITFNASTFVRPSPDRIRRFIAAKLVVIR